MGVGPVNEGGTGLLVGQGREKERDVIFKCGLWCECSEMFILLYKGRKVGDDKDQVHGQDRRRQ